MYSSHCSLLVPHLTWHLHLALFSSLSLTFSLAVPTLSPSFDFIVLSQSLCRKVLQELDWQRRCLSHLCQHPPHNVTHNTYFYIFSPPSHTRTCVCGGVCSHSWGDAASWQRIRWSWRGGWPPGRPRPPPRTSPGTLWPPNRSACLCSRCSPAHCTWMKSVTKWQYRPLWWMCHFCSQKNSTFLFPDLLYEKAKRLDKSVYLLH